MSSSSLHQSSGATEHAQPPEKRVGNNRRGSKDSDIDDVEVPSPDAYITMAQAKAIFETLIDIAKTSSQPSPLQFRPLCQADPPPPPPPPPQSETTDKKRTPVPFIQGEGAKKPKNESDSTIVEKKLHRCSHCQIELPPSKLFIEADDPTFDWCGSLPLTCLDCYERRTGERFSGPGGGHTGAWTKKCQTAWRHRKFGAEQVVRQIRSMSFANAQRDIDAKHAGESRKAFRARLLQETTEISIAIYESIRKDYTPEQKMQALKVFDTWQQAWEIQANEDFFISEFVNPFQLDAQLSDFVDQILPGIDIMYTCRHESCLHVTRATEWIQGVEHGWYKCPMCATRYYPWQTKSTWIKANKVLFLDGELAGKQYSRQQLYGAGNENEFQGWKAYALIWPDTKADALLASLKAITANIEDELKHCADRKSQYAYLMRGAYKPPIRAFLSHKTLTRDIKEQVDDSNRKSTTCRFSYAHIEEEGFYTLDLKPMAVAMREPLEQEDFLRILACVFYLITNAQRSKM